ncbi:MAG TPA: hypothetical protein VMA71_08675 [Alloacidobacterium sp.]|nr:hypothetical protein [Alloacidobacterium sp.]
MRRSSQKHPLDRLLRLRSLVADVSRIELEMRLQELAQVERAVTRAQQNGQALRRESFTSMVRDRRGEWLEAEALRAWVGWEEDLLEKECRRKTAVVEVAKAEYLERRKECRQVESVIEAQAAAAVVEQGRREQRELDDWFGQRIRPKGTAKSGAV